MLFARRTANGSTPLRVTAVKAQEINAIITQNTDTPATRRQHVPSSGLAYSPSMRRDVIIVTAVATTEVTITHMHSTTIFEVTARNRRGAATMVVVSCLIARLSEHFLRTRST